MSVQSAPLTALADAAELTLAERRLLAGLMREPDGVAAACVGHGVTVDDLYHHAHRLVWGACWELIGAGCGCDAAAVYALLRATGDLADLPPPAGLWLAELLDEDPTGAWCHYACTLVRRAGLRRGVIRAAAEVMRSAYAGDRDPGNYERQWAALGAGERGTL